MSASRIPILIVSDCEPDPRETKLDDVRRFEGFERYFALLSEQRAHLSARTGAPAHFTWLWRLDPQIEKSYGSAGWPMRTYAAEIAAAKREGDAIGVHVHAWRWDGGAKRWIADFGDPAWVETCVRTALAEFQQATGAPCRVMSFGDGWHNQASVDLIERLGIAVDLTLEPGFEAALGMVASERSTGILPDRRKMPVHPYRPARGDFLQPDTRGESKLWMIPMSTGPDPAAPRRAFAKLNIAFEPERFMLLFERALAQTPRPFVAIAARSDVGSNAGLMRYAHNNLQSMREHALAERFAFMTPDEAIALLTDKAFDRSGRR